MSHFPPPYGTPLNYQQGYYGPPPPPTRPVLQFLGGLGAGTLVSLLGWGLAFMQSAPPMIVMSLLWLIPVGKLASGITFLCMRPYRLLGGGILTSLALGFLIFFGFCAANMKF